MALGGMGRFVAALALLWVCMPGSASAHEGHDHNSPEAIPNMLTRVDAVSPSIQGVELRVLERGEYLELRNRTQTDVTILGYENEPYLKVSPVAVFENAQSPSAQVNGRSEGRTGEIIDTDSKAPPEWRQISGSPVATWHDHRVHWMSPTPPPDVEDNPYVSHVVFDDWEIGFLHGDQPFSARGDLVWQPSPQPLVAGLVALSLAVILTAVGLRYPRPVLLVCLTSILVSVVAHHLGARPPQMESAWQTFTGILASSPTTWAAWLAALTAVVMLARNVRTQEAAVLAAFAGAVVLFTNGIADIDAIVPYGIDRIAVPVNIGVGLSAVIVSVVNLYNSTRRQGNVTAIGEVS